MPWNGHYQESCLKVAESVYRRTVIIRCLKDKFIGIVVLLLEEGCLQRPRRN